MDQITIYQAGYSKAIQQACRILVEKGIRFAGEPGPEVTHLLLPVPSFESDGRIIGGGILEHLLADLPEDVTIVGGNLEHTALMGYRTADLLKDGTYVARNAAITADCAVRVAAERMQTVFENCPMLVIGWGRIGKCLARLLKTMGADVTVAARKESDRQILEALGYHSAEPCQMKHHFGKYRVIFNTVPAPVISAADAAGAPNSIKIELASNPGIDAPDVIKALGLPGKTVPESSGKLIAETVIRVLKKEGIR